MSRTQSVNCLICESLLNDVPEGFKISGFDGGYYRCPKCGDYGLTGTAEVLLPQWLPQAEDKRAVLSHAIYRRQMSEDWPVMDWEVCKKLIEDGTLPSPSEQADNLIRWLGNNNPGLGELIPVETESHQAIFGSKTPSGVLFIAEEMIKKGRLVGRIAKSMGGSGTAFVNLSMDGWEHYEALRKGIPSGHKAFMAMKFGDPSLDQMFKNHFRPAVADTGFALQTLQDEPRAGLIDDRLRVEITSSRFLIADLTHDNSGAYWEAGFAEGLDKPVIYTCEASKFDKASTHFDTNHHLTVKWDFENPEEAVQELKATIRYTIPEARQQDPE